MALAIADNGGLDALLGAPNPCQKQGKKRAEATRGAFFFRSSLKMLYFQPIP